MNSKISIQFLRRLDAISDHPLRAGTYLFLLTLVGAALFSTLGSWPAPITHDEFGYLLLGDTFANGRITNPTHPHWEFFETFHVLQQPSYTAKYPPLQGIFLAAGQLLAGSPVVGVWLSSGLMVAAVYWALLQWIRPKWALLGAVLLMLQVGVLGYWSQSFWGGAVAATGGALATGAVGALVRNTRLIHGFILGVGLAVLANSRPVEGLLLTLALGIYLVCCMPTGADARAKICRSLIPTVVIGSLTLVAMGYYNHRVTGSEFRFPYQAYEKQYGVGANFIWEEPEPLRDYRHPALSEYYREYGIERALRMRTPGGFALSVFRKLYRLVDRLIGPGLGLLLVPLLIPRKDLLFAAWIVLLFVCELLVTLGGWPHYFAPATMLVYLLIAGGLREIYHREWFGLSGQRVFIGILLVFPILFLLRAGVELRQQPQRFVQARDAMMSCLHDRSGDDLVFVHYGPERQSHFDWVYNEADIDGADIVWARSISKAKNAELQDYFSNRRSWILTVTADSVALRSAGDGEHTCIFTDSSG